ncbi:LADA_0H10946g1_1 [Lachancea dasiensis]|uniref:LADA_0H10946g1_1 n=1 Tax=Lachancea dasiensis TaxID=1072105 RepID=A0A1G4K3C1_9SACH|nr:LADA_0H10946g1_1 [Lachancea dasiensis]
MTLEGVRRFGRRVSKQMSINRAPFEYKRRGNKKKQPMAARRAVYDLLEQAEADYAKGETDMAIYRLTRILSSWEKENTEPFEPLPTQEAPKTFSLGDSMKTLPDIPVRIIGPRASSNIGMSTEPGTVASGPQSRVRKLLVRSNLNFSIAPQGYDVLSRRLERANPHCTSYNHVRNMETANTQNTDGVHCDSSLDNTALNVDPQVFEFSDMVERSFNLLSISDSIAILEDDTTRFEGRDYSHSPASETILSKSLNY